MLIRAATLADLQVITDLGVKALNDNPYPGLVIDRDRIKQVAVDCISTAGNFAWVAESSGEVVAAVCALVHDMMFYQRMQATVVQFYTVKPNAGLPLIKEFLKWARGRRGIKLICFTLECRADPRIGKLLNRLGLEVELPVYMEIR